MKRILSNLALLLVVAGLLACSQNNQNNEESKDISPTTDTIKTQEKSNVIPASKSDVIFEMADEMPKYVGGVDKMVEYLESKINPRKDLFKKKTTFFTSFVVEKDSSISNVKVYNIKDPHVIKGISEIIKGMDWTPAINRGKRVRCQYLLPLFFPYVMPDGPVKSDANISIH